MPIPFPQRPPNVAADRAGPSTQRRNGYRAAAPRRSPDVLAEARHQELIEATFDRVRAYERLGDLERALEWLNRAAALSGDLPQAYRARQKRWLRVASRRRGAAAGSWKDGRAGWEKGQRTR